MNLLYIISFYASLISLSRGNYLQTLLGRNNRSTEATNKDPLPGISWRSLAVVNGLRNKDVCFLIFSSWHQNGKLYRQRIMPAARTWMRLAMHVVVVIEDTIDARLAFRQCKMTETSTITTYKCHHEPTVILSRECPSDPYSGLCCKVDELVRYLTHEAPNVYSTLKYAIVGDDDYFFRVDRVLLWLSYVERANISSIPLISNGFAAYKHDPPPYPDCPEIVTYGWYGALMFNKAALDRYARTPYALFKTCTAWSGNQDTTLGVFGWMLQLNHVHFPGVEQVSDGVQGRHEHYLGSKTTVHHVYHNNREGAHPCDAERWTKDMRYNQEAAIGCGSLALPAPGSDKGMNMYQMWEMYANTQREELELPPNHWRLAPGLDPVPIIKPLVGYNLTKHSRKYDILSEWHDYGPKDCENFQVQLTEIVPPL